MRDKHDPNQPRQRADLQPAASVPDEIPYNSLPIAKRVEDRPTEDELAQRSLGGPKGQATLPPAPMTKNEEEQYPKSNDPGHVA